MQQNYCHPIGKIVNAAGGSRALYEMSEKELINIVGISEKYAEDIVRRRAKWDLDYEYEKLRKSEVDFVPSYHEKFPKRLKSIKNSPFGIFVIGELPPDDVTSVAIIGARNCSSYGRMMAERFGTDLGSIGISLVSGMAYGIDGISQMAAIEAGGKSYAVLGCGVNICYPASNRKLYEKLKYNGGIVSEYGLYTNAQSRLFPARNRIISALSDLCLVIEARERSGTMITVDMALEQGKEVAIVPGRITDPLSSGCIKLWKQGALPVTGVEDILFQLGEDYNTRKKRYRNIVTVTNEEKMVFAELDVYAKSVGEISDRVNMPVANVLEALVGLARLGLVCEVSNGYFVISRECAVVARSGRRV